MRRSTAEGQPNPLAIEQRKRVLRQGIERTRARRGSDRTGDTARAVRALAACAGASTVAAYASRPGEPATDELIDALWSAQVRVLLPRLRREPDWAWYAGPGTLVEGRFGIPQPADPGLGADALALADVIWVPGLAGTPDGRRLGTGGGWYDRALTRAREGVPVGLLLFDQEVVEDLPTAAWDRRVSLIVTESVRIDVSAERRQG